jgi:hypothetical protein
MSRAAELLKTVTRLGGRVTLEKGKLKARVPADRPELFETLRASRAEILALLSPPERIRNIHISRGPSEPIPPGVEPEYTTQLRRVLQQGPIRPPGTVKDAVAFLIANGEARWTKHGTLEAVQP